jgi:hypothetical protein
MADRKRTDELTVITKTYDLILWSCNHTGKFPRNHRFVLGERIERNLYDLLELLIRAKYNRNRQELLEQANLVLEILRFQMRLAKDLQCLKIESYGFAAKAIDEVGKLVGGWLKSIDHCNPLKKVVIYFPDDDLFTPSTPFPHLPTISPGNRSSPGVETWQRRRKPPASPLLSVMFSPKTRRKQRGRSLLHWPQTVLRQPRDWCIS